MLPATNRMHTTSGTPATGTYAMYFNNHAFEKLPQVKVTVQGKEIVFLADSGATHSVIQHSLMTDVKLSGRSIYSVGASGQPIKEKFSVPLSTSLDSVSGFKHSFLISQHCPINLLGRDLLLRMNLSLVPGPNGLEVMQADTGATYTMLGFQGNGPLWAYQWLLMGTTGVELLQTATDAVLPTAIPMRPGELHCTACVSSEMISFYQDEFLLTPADPIKLEKMFWSGERSAFSVILTDKQQAFFNVPGSVPHVSLTRGPGDEWKDLGPFVKSCQEAPDWQPSAAASQVLYSPSLHAYSLCIDTMTDAERVLHVANPRKSVTALSTSLPPELEDVPKTLWADGPYDVGLIRGVEPVSITPKSEYRPCQQQYPLRQEAVDGITPVFNSLLKKGVIIPCDDSPVRTPMLPVKKPRPLPVKDDWRFVQDLRAVNNAVQQRTPNVPNPHTILSQVPPGTTHYSVVDLSNAFFSVPVHKDSQFWFAFQFQGRGYTFTRLPQGYCESPTIYNAALARSLETLTLTSGTALLQYVDDLLIAAPSEEQCKADTAALLHHLAKEGHKASLKKLQFCQTTVTFLGHVLSASSKAIASSRSEAAAQIPKPVTKKQMLSFLGLVGYCRAFIPNYSGREKPLRDIVPGTGPMSTQLMWTPEAHDAFDDLKMALQSAPALGIPDPQRPFTQTVDERNGCMSSVLLQDHGGQQRPVAYFSSRLDAVAAGLPRCLRAVAAAERALCASRDIVGYAPLTLLVPHAVTLILNEQRTSHLSAARYLRYHTCLLEMPNVTVKRCTTLNPASLLPSPEDGEPHDCLAELEISCSPRPDLSDQPLTNPDFVLYSDGSSSRDAKGTNRVGYAVVSDSSVLTSGSLPCHMSAQAAELVALTEACKLARDKSVTIYTDSRYAFGVVHDFGALWRHRKFLKSDGKPVLNHVLIAKLLDAILLPSQIAVCKCAAHTKATDPVAKGNASADAAAKAAAVASPTTTLAVSLPADSPPASLSEMQAFASANERTTWKNCGATYRDGVWVGPSNKPCLPKHFFPAFCKLTHGLDHVSKGGMLGLISQSWFTKGFSAAAAKHCSSCLICARCNIGRATQVSNQAAHPPPTKPFEHLMMDFIELTPAGGKKYCLVMVDMWSKWVEAFPCPSQSANDVAKALLTEILPRWGIPVKISSDNGTHFVNQALKQIGELFNMDMRQHCAYHPASGGAVERENGTIKAKLLKCCEETGLPWPKALPIVLMYMRMRRRARANLSPFEILFAAPPNVGTGPPGSLPSTTLCEDAMLTYCCKLSSQLSDIRTQVKEALPTPAAEPLHRLEPGDFVLIKDFRRKHWRSNRWQGPFQVLLTTHTAVKVAERATWVHASHCKRVSSALDTNEGAPE